MNTLAGWLLALVVVHSGFALLGFHWLAHRLPTLANWPEAKRTRAANIAWAVSLAALALALDFAAPAWLRAATMRAIGLWA
jgi:hypothetical protein